MANKPSFRIVNADDRPPADYVRRDPIIILRDRLNKRPTRFGALAADWREFVSEVRGSPYSHALVAIGTVIGWTALLVLPLLIGERF